MIAEWSQYYQLEPFGEERADLRAALVACLVANANRDLEKHPEPFEITDFLLKFDDEPEEPKKQTWQEQLAIVEMLNIAFGGKDLRQHDADQ